MQFSEEIQSDLKAAVNCIINGGIVLYPTDTVWGIGCDATNAAAVRKIFEIKKRNDSKALISLVGNMKALQTLTGLGIDKLKGLISGERPVTVIYPAVKGLCREVISDDGSGAVRLTREPFSAALCDAAGVPLVSTSANVSGYPTPKIFDDIEPEIIDSMDYVCTSGRYGENACGNCPPSRIIKLNADGSVVVIRE